MFGKLSLLVLVAPLVSALTITSPTNIDSGTVGTITWTLDSTDPTVASIELTNPSFNNAIAIANNVDLTTLSLTLQFPAVAPGGSYTIQFVNIGNINQVYAESPIFTIGAASSISTSATSTATSPTGTTTIVTVSGTVTSANSLVPVSSITSTSPTGTGTGTSTGTGTAGTTSTTTPASAAVSSRFALTNVGGYAVLLLSVVAGAAITL